MQNKCAAVAVLTISVIGILCPVQAAKKVSPDTAKVTNNLGVTGQGIYGAAPDSKLPGKFLFKIWARSVTGQSVDKDSIGTLNGVTAILFQHGIATARLYAPTASGDTSSQTVTASGRVHIVSITQPGTTMDADTIVWHAKTNIIDAMGNVVYHNGKNGMVWHGPHFTANTAMKTITSAGPGRASFH